MAIPAAGKVDLGQIVFYNESGVYYPAIVYALGASAGQWNLQVFETGTALVTHNNVSLGVAAGQFLLPEQYAAANQA